MWCGTCHLEHRGHDVALTPEIPVTDDQIQTILAHGPKGLEAPGLCRGCHAEGLSDVLEDPKPVRDRPDAPRERALVFESFAHAEHLDPSYRRDRDLPECVDCHRSTGDVSADGAEFTSPDYAGCLECEACHTGQETADLKTTTLFGGTGLYSFGPRPHALTQECRECHLVGSEAIGPASSEGRRFEHGDHLTHDRAGVLDFETARQECVECHGPLEDSSTLAAACSAADPTAGTVRPLHAAEPGGANG